MAYIRGHYYIWSDDTHTHLWAADGYDGWEQSAWAEQSEPVSTRQSAAFGRASGVRVRFETLDEYVAMRLAELVEEGQVRATIERTLLAHGDNEGCAALQRQAARLTAALVPLTP